MGDTISGTVTDDRDDDSKAKTGLKKAGRSMRDSSQSQLDSIAASDRAQSNERSPNTDRTSNVQLDSYKRGGRVRKSGAARLHRGEVVKRKRKYRMSGRT